MSVLVKHINSALACAKGCLWHHQCLQDSSSASGPSSAWFAHPCFASCPILTRCNWRCRSLQNWNICGKNCRPWSLLKTLKNMGELGSMLVPNTVELVSELLVLFTWCLAIGDLQALDLLAQFQRDIKGCAAALGMEEVLTVDENPINLKTLSLIHIWRCRRS